MQKMELRERLGLSLIVCIHAEKFDAQPLHLGVPGFEKLGFGPTQKKFSVAM